MYYGRDDSPHLCGGDDLPGDGAVEIEDIMDERQGVHRDLREVEAASEIKQGRCHRTLSDRRSDSG